ncbi:L,D-transpeptidase [Bauldia sp.]|uniref:L,D-transpeptidase n=1 Tax=Bauldia sp. TaxID=2575872 RepID=UPI003BABEF63
MKRSWRRLLVPAVATVFFVSGAGIASAEVLDGTQVASLAEAPATEAASEPTRKRVVARVDLSDQTMHVYVDERLEHVFTISSGRGSYRTPTGRWNAEWLSPRHRSRKYNNAPMPWSVFYYRGYAVHGTTDLKRLGQPASHGCIRLHPDNAELFYKLVKSNGKQNTLISVVR